MKKLLVTITAVMMVMFSISSCCPCRLGAGNKTQIDEGSSWQVVQMAGKTFENGANDELTITFSEDGALSGKGTCNRLMGTYQATESRALTFGAIGSTRAMCPNQNTEDQFFKLLSETTHYTIEGKMLMLMQNGAVKIILQRM